MSATGKAAQIPDALLAKFLALEVGSPPLPLCYPDIDFDPAIEAPDGRYLEASYHPNRPAWEGLSEGRLDQGLFQVTIHWPRGAGIIAPAEVAQVVLDHFAKGTLLVSGSTKVKLTKQPWSAGPIIEATETCTPITIPWNA